MHPTIRAYLTAGFTTPEQMLEHARLRGKASYHHVLGALGESAGNIKRLLGFHQAIADRIHVLFGAYDFPAAKLMASIGYYEDGPVAIEMPKDFKADVGTESVGDAVDFALQGLWEKTRYPSENQYDRVDGLIAFFKANQAIIPKINSAKIGDDCIDLVRQSILSKKKSISQSNVILKLSGGWSWVDIGSCSDDVEAAEMQHCGVDEQGNLVSLRDPNNASHVTMTYNHDDNTIYQIKGKQNSIPVRKYWAAIIEFFKKTGAKLEDYNVIGADHPGILGGGGSDAKALHKALTDAGIISADITEGDVTRQNSTAMVVVPAQPPGKNVCAMIRKLVGERTKLIVVAQPGPLAPGNFEALLRASMPDVEKKLRIMDAGDSLADAVSSAERNRHYRPSQALEVFCDDQQARNFAQEIRDGSLKFDPTVIRVRPMEIAADDMDSLLKAVQGDDLAAMHRVLDPHVFSDQNALKDYKAAVNGGQSGGLFTVGGESEPMPKESVDESGDVAGAITKQKMQGLVARIRRIVARELSEIEIELEIQDPTERERFIKSRIQNILRTIDSEKTATDSIVVERIFREFLTDIAPSRELGIAKLDTILRHELGDHFDELEYLGSGRNGSAYRTPDGLILKITTDHNEVMSAARLKGLECEYIHRIHTVTHTSYANVWVILQEGGLEKLPSQYAEEFDLAVEILETIGAGHALRLGDAHAVKEVMVRSGYSDLCELVAEVMRKFGIGGMLREVSELGLSADFHSGNIMLREGRPVLTDLGTPGDDPNDYNNDPQGVGRQVSEYNGGAQPASMGGSAQMRGSNSSAWAGGRLVLSKPEQHVPEDENETEGDRALDQDIVGGGLDWGRNGRRGSGY